MTSLHRFLLPVAAAALLSACGGGVSIGFFDDDFDEPFFDLRPFPSGRAGSVTVSAATDTVLNGTYSAADTEASRVVGFVGNPDTCRFRFDGLREPGTGRFLAGEIRYLPNTFAVVASIVFVGSEEFRLEGAAGVAGVALDRANNTVVFGNAVVPTARNNGASVTLNGSVPMRNDTRPSGC